MQMTKASGQWVLMPSATVAMTSAFLPMRSSRRHAGGAREAGGDDHHVGAGDSSVVGAAGEGRVEAVDRAGLRDVERLAGRHAAEHVEQDDVAELLEANQVGERAADITGADEGDLVPGHGASPSEGARMAPCDIKWSLPGRYP